MADLDIKVTRNKQDQEGVEVILANRGKKLTDKDGKVSFPAPAVGGFFLPCCLRGKGWAMGTTLPITADNECEVEV